MSALINRIKKKKKNCLKNILKKKKKKNRKDFCLKFPYNSYSCSSSFVFNPITNPKTSKTVMSNPSTIKYYS